MTTAERQALVRQWLGLAYQQAVRAMQRSPLARRQASVEDLFQEGVIGLMIAARKFDPAHGCKFITYAFHWVRQTIGRAVLLGSVVRVPLDVAQAVADGEVAMNRRWARRLARARAAMGVGTLPTDEEGEQFPVLAAKVQGRDSLELDALAAALSHVEPRRQEALRRRFGLDDGVSHLLSEVGAEMGVSTERARQYEAQGIDELRAWLEAGKVPDNARLCVGYRGPGHARCVSPAVLDGFCPLCHPVHKLADVQGRLERMFERSETSGEWKSYERLEKKERALLRQVDALRRQHAPP